MTGRYGWAGGFKGGAGGGVVNCRHKSVGSVIIWGAGEVKPYLFFMGMPNGILIGGSGGRGGSNVGGGGAGVSDLGHRYRRYYHWFHGCTKGTEVADRQWVQVPVVTYLKGDVITNTVIRATGGVSTNILRWMAVVGVAIHTVKSATFGTINVDNGSSQ